MTTQADETGDFVAEWIRSRKKAGLLDPAIIQLLDGCVAGGNISDSVIVNGLVALADAAGDADDAR
jgi:hypothetical protein